MMSIRYNKFYPFRNCTTYLSFTLLFFSLNNTFAQSDAKVTSDGRDTNYTNSLGLQMIHIKAGKFQMGQNRGGDFDERPAHPVTIGNDFFISSTEICNAVYEQFDPSHRQYRGKYGLSSKDSEPVIFVSWQEASAFCEWLTKKENRNYRLPTEAEWEYVCRAGTRTPYCTGDTLPALYYKNQHESWKYEPVNLQIGRTPPNPWGIFDMYGNVEEWCLDWYGPYTEKKEVNPDGYAEADFKVTRGGSHGTDIFYLRSANRSGALPEERHPLIGFRVVMADLNLKKTKKLSFSPRWAKDVNQKSSDWKTTIPADLPFFKGPVPFVKIPDSANGPLFSEHNHCPALAPCPNGDLLAIWYTTKHESGRELAIAASRLRKGTNEWDTADLFWDAPDRNDHASELIWDGQNTIYHLNGLSSDATWGKLILIMRKSTDNGVTWSKAQILNSEYGLRNMPIAGGFFSSKGDIVLPVDAVTPGTGGSAVHIIHPDGTGLYRHASGTPEVEFKDGAVGGRIAGIHAGVVELNDGRLLAFGRGDKINGFMPQSISSDYGKAWTYAATEFPPISSGQRLVLLKLKEGALLFISFTGDEPYEPLAFIDENGKTIYRHGMFAALSFDEGKTWPVKKLISDFKPARAFNGGAWTDDFILSPVSAEPKGYLVAKQTPDLMIHLISSALYYKFNLAWLLKKMPDIFIAK